MKQIIRLTESELENVIQNIVNEAFNNSSKMDEGLWDNLKTGANTFLNNDGKNGIKGRWDAAKKNYNLQSEMDDLQNLVQKLSQYIDNGQISPQMTIAQLVGGKYNNKKFGSVSGKIANKKSQIRKNGYNGNF